MLDQAIDQLRAEMVEGQSADGLVTATVNGSGELVALRLDPTLLVTTTPRQMGASTVDAVMAARSAASILGERLTQEIGLGARETQP